MDNPSIMRKLLHEEAGIALIPSKTWNVEAENEKLNLREVSNFSVRRYVYLKWKKDMYLTENMKMCIQVIQNFFGEKM